VSKHNCTTHHEACDCKQAAHKREIDTLRASLAAAKERIKGQDQVIADFWEQHKRDDAFFIMHPEDARLKAITEMREWRTRAESAEAALKEAEWRAAEWERASGLNATEMSRYQRQAIAAETLAERYRRALVKAEAFLDENDYRLPMSGREAAALATIRIALQQGKGEGE
jgi:chromosome segregation ATPase